MPTWSPEQYRAWAQKHAKAQPTIVAGSGHQPAQNQAQETAKAGLVAGTVRKRIRQSQKPPTKLEVEGLAWLKAKYSSPVIRWHTQAWRVRIANGAWYKVDICAELPKEGMHRLAVWQWHAWETKCLKGKNAARGILALKCAASAFPEVVWHLLTKEDGQFQDQIILP